jgi:release factor glutamine methyltransferase
MYELKKVFRQYISLLKDNGVESSEMDVLLLFNFALDTTSDQYIFAEDRQISKFELERIKTLIDRRARHEPVAKIIGKKLFWDYSFYVDVNVLDPRPETEVLVQAVLNNVGAARTILDLGTGSGCIAISLALMLKQVSVSASDISEKALLIARQNAEENGAMVSFVISDWFSSFSKRFDIIVSNPPYISSSDFTKLPNDVRSYDPKLALVGGRDGLDCYRKIAQSLSLHLNNDGLAFFEIGFGQKQGVTKIFSQEGFSVVNVWNDINSLERVICVKKDA